MLTSASLMAMEAMRAWGSVSEFASSAPIDFVRSTQTELSGRISDETTMLVCGALTSSTSRGSGMHDHNPATMTIIIEAINFPASSIAFKHFPSITKKTNQNLGKAEVRRVPAGYTPWNCLSHLAV